VTDPLREALEQALGDTYAIERELAGGGMSRVFVATDRALNRAVVIKVLPPDLAADVKRERFKREIQVAAQLHHPHIVPLLTAGEHGDLLYYTMPYIEGESLGAAIARRGRLPTRDVVRIMADVAEVLAYAHARGVIHRDIKPGNILMQGTHALVTDFGVAKALSAALPTGVGTTAGLVLGTPAYMAPEQLAGDPAADHRMDLYALGLVAYEALTGASPFAGPSPRETMANQLTRVPPPVHTINPEVPPALARLISRCLQKDPALRPPSAAALLAELEALPPSVTRSPRARLASVALGAIAVATLGVSAVLLIRTAGGGGRNGAASALAPAGQSPVEVETAPDTVFVREPVQLSREDSLAIARALAPRRQELERLGASVEVLESLRVEMERAVADSVRRLMAMLRERGVAPGRQGPRPGPGGDAPRAADAPAAGPGPPRSRPVVVLMHYGTPASTDLARALDAARDSMARALRAEGRYEVVDLDSLAAGLAGMELAARLRSATQVLARFQSQGDSVVLRVTLRPPGWPITQRTVDLSSAPAPHSDPLATLNPLIARLREALRRATSS
jgi:serine/threonine-protein kinase